MSDLTNNLLEDLSKDITLSRCPKIFIKPNIPSKKLSNALSSYANNIKEEDVLLLVDDTVFGSAKDGLILTSTTIATKRSYENPKLIKLDQVKEISFYKSEILINSISFSSFIQVTHKDLGGLSEIINKCLLSFSRKSSEAIDIKNTENESTSKMSLKDYILLSGVTSITSEHIFFYPNIPQKKLVGALSNYNGLVKSDDVYILIDDTVFGSAKDSFLITKEYFLAKESFSDPQKITLDSIQEIEAIENEVFVNKRKFCKMTLCGKMESRCVVSILDDYLNISRREKIKSESVENIVSTAEVLEICKKHTKPDLIDGGAQGNFRIPQKVPSFHVHPEIPENILKMVSFSLLIERHDQILAVSDLTTNTCNAKNAFVITETGIFFNNEKEGGIANYISWNKLKDLKIENFYESGRYCGVAFSSGEKILCTIKNAVVKPFGLSLIQDLMSICGGDSTVILEKSDKISTNSSETRNYSSTKEVDSSTPRVGAFGANSQDRLFYLVKTSKTVDNVLSFFDYDGSLISKIQNEFPTLIVKSLESFRKNIADGHDMPEFKNDVSTVEISSGLIALLCILMSHRNISPRVSQQVVLEGIKATFSIKMSVQSDELGSLILSTVEAYTEMSKGDPKAVFGVILARLLCANSEGKIRRNYNFKEIEGFKENLSLFMVMIESGFSQFHDNVVFEVDFFINQIIKSS